MNALARLTESDAVRRLVDRDPTLFTADVDGRQKILQRLGWLDLATAGSGRVTLVENLAAALVKEGATDVVLLGMGGSSLTAIVLSEVIGSGEGMPRLHVLDSTSPSMVRKLMSELDPATTYFLLSSKSGTTIEPLSLYAIFRGWMEESFERPRAGQHFIAITDPGTPLEKMRAREVMRVALSAPPAVGGRFSALSIFGLAPAGLIGIDLMGLLGPAQSMEAACHRPAEDNPGALLGAWIFESLEKGADKLTLVTSERFRSFGLWVEQLVAESTGKENKGVVPVVEHSANIPSGFRDDRAVVVLREETDSGLERFAASVRLTHPVMEFVLDNPLEIGAEFVRWQYAVALLGHLMDINPFDEPNVSEAKDVTGAVLHGTEQVPAAVADLDGIWATYAGGLQGAAAPAMLSDAISPMLAATRPGDYIAVLAYLPYEDRYFAPLNRAAARLSAALGVAVCVEAGPRYLHSTGQLHKGGRDTGVFLVLTSREHENLAIPGRDFSLAQLYRAQAEGDLVTLAKHGRRVMRLDLPGEDAAALDAVALALGSAAG